MAISYEIIIHQDYLEVKSEGFDESLQEVEDYANSIAKIALENGKNKILCDERKLRYSLSIFETFELAEAEAKHLSTAPRIAIVFNSNYTEYARFFETAAINRGLIVKVTTDIDEAKKWLAVKPGY